MRAVRTRVVLLALLLVGAGIPAPVAGQTSSTVQLDLTFQLDPEDGTVHVTFEVEDPGSLRTIQLALGELEALQGDPSFEGDWRQEDGRAVADLEETPQASAQWTSDGRIRAETLEGEGYTTYVGGSFAVVKAGSMTPNIRYSFPQDRKPTFQTDLTVQAPDDWGAKGPWPSQGGAFQLDRPLPRGFLAVGPSIEEVTLGSGEDAYRIVRLAGASETATTERILLEARSYLGGLWGRTAHQQFIVVAPDPMFRGGLGSPAGVFLHGDADGSVVAHEMVHAYQGFRFSRQPGEATVWLGEGTAVVHGVLLEVASGVKSREEARTFLQERAEKAKEEHAVDLTSAVYGSGNEQAAYTKGAVVVTAIDDRIREATDNQYTLSDVLKELNRRGASSDSFTVSTSGFLQTIQNVTDASLESFFDRYVHDSSVPDLGSIFPGQVSVRIVGTDPDPPVEGEPFEVLAQLTNLDTQETQVDVPVLVNGSQRGRLVATLPAGASARADADVEALDRGSYQVRIRGATAEVRVRTPAEPSANVTVWPPQPVAGENVTLGARISNVGEAPYRGDVQISLDGEPILQRRVDVGSDDVRTISRTLQPLEPGSHEVRVVGVDGRVLAEQTFEVTQEVEQAQAPGASAVLAVTLMAAVAFLVRAREPR